MDHRTHRAAHRVEGKSAAPGIALGPLVHLVAARPEAHHSRSAVGEQQALADALEASRLDLVALAGKVEAEDAEAILSFQIALLEDENLAAPAFALIADGEVASKAWLAAIDPEIATYDQADDLYFRARASDLRDLRDRVLRRLAGEVDEAVPSGVIVAAVRYAAIGISRHRLARRRPRAAPRQPLQPCRHPRAVARRADDRRRRYRSSREQTRCRAGTATPVR